MSSDIPDIDQAASEIHLVKGKMLCFGGFHCNKLA